MPRSRRVVDHVPGCAACGGVEAGGRLVEEDQLGVADQGEAEVEPASLAAGEARRLLVVLAGEADERDRLGHGARVAVVAGVELERLSDGEAGVGCGLLQDDPDPVAPGACSFGRVDAEHGHVSFGSGSEAFEDLDGGRLAGAVRAEEGEDLAALDFEVDPAHGVGVGVALAQSVHADGGSVAAVRGSSSPCWWRSLWLLRCLVSSWVEPRNGPGGASSGGGLALGCSCGLIDVHPPLGLGADDASGAAPLRCRA